jgi:two-component system CheB/CheR fusion protein
MNKELQDANEELQVANEEMVLTHEELQATNEELETNNEELQATNEELQTTNDELRARSQELQEALELLETESGRLSEMVALAPFYILVLRGPNLQVTAYNPRYSRLMEGRDVQGRPLAEVAGQFWEGGAGLVDLAHEVYRSDLPRTSSRVLTYIPNDRHEPVAGYFVFTVVPSHDAGGQVDGVVLYAADVTEEQARRVEEERARLRLIFEHAEQIGLALYDAETAQLLVASPRYFTIIERDRSEHHPVQLGETWAAANVFGELGTAGKVWDAVIEQREPSRMGEVRRKLAQDHGETIWDVSLTPISDLTHPDRIRYVLVTAIEMTEQVKAREEIERLDRLKDEFLSLASHELRTPLTPLMGYAGMLHSMVSQPKTVPDKGQRERLVRLSETFNRQLGRLRVLVNDLVDVGRLESGKFRLERSRLALAAVVASAVDEARLIKPSQPIDLEIEEAAEALVVAGDRERLIQVILNLMQNAITYAAQSERLIVRLKCEQTDGTAWACIEVQDFGPGIPPEALPSLFTRFYQVDRKDHRSRGGLGLGLYICKQIVEQHGGTIGVESTAGQGSTFIVRLPLAEV